MSKVEVDQIDPQSGTTLTLGTSGDTIVVPSGVTFNSSAATNTLPSSVVTTTGTQTLTNKSIVATQLTGTITPSDDTVTLAKMAPGTDGNIISYDASGNPVAVATGSAAQVLTSAGAGAPPTFATATVPDNAITLAKMASGTDGNIISYDASGNPVAIATGNDGQVLTSAGAGAQPAFETLPSSGKVLQVKFSQQASITSTTSSSYQDSGLTIAITPSSSSNKIYCFVNLCSISTGTSSSSAMSVRILRDSSEIALTQNFGFGQTTGANYFTLGLQKEDSPSSTSELTYKVQFRNRESNTVTINSYSGNTSTLIAMEVAG